jgi:hypothetical protein
LEEKAQQLQKELKLPETSEDFASGNWGSGEIAALS